MSERTVVITGSTGLIGTELTSTLQAWGWRVKRLFREPQRAAKDPLAGTWDPTSGSIDTLFFRDVDVVIHLAGAGIAEHRWTPRYKSSILESRVRSTSLLVDTFAALDPKPKTFLVASAMGYYGDRMPDEIVTEESLPGEGFLAETCRAWESASKPAEAMGIRVVSMRFGVVLSPKGGMLRKILPLFRWGLGGPIGNGNQVMSWISLEEIPPIVRFLIEQDNLNGPVNIVTPYPVSNFQFTRLLGKVLHRPTFLAVPSFVLRWGLGEMADELLLSGSRGHPNKLTRSSYSFRFPRLHDTLSRWFER